ncbi:MAG: DUF3440 domain-containing protein [Alphaproteobacteria bacterium]|nr:DUF3440 domain-containing protein [Alphaproteobacteria bacterium]
MKKYLSKNVYEAAQERLYYVFSEFDNIYLSFSGGKDSGAMFNLTMDYIKQHNIKKKIGLLIIDLEAQYNITIQYIEEMLSLYHEYINLYRVCLPFNLRNSVSNYNPYWCCWEEGKDWVRAMPENSINLSNHSFPFYRYRMEFEEFTPLFGKWYARAHEGKTACLVGIRADESLNRYRAIISNKKLMYNNKNYSTKITENLYNFYPIYDWKTEDIWTYNGKFKKPYNKLYDKFYYAGVKLSKMRVCEPYGDDQRIGLNLFKTIEPDVWQKLVFRVEGANSGQLYCGTKFLGYRNVELPANHTWKSYTKFLLNTLPNTAREHYIKKFKTYIKYWYRHGSALGDDVISQLQNKGFQIKDMGMSKRGNKNKLAIAFRNIPDNTDSISYSQELLSWKRMAICIIKNDLSCRSLSFNQTKEDIFKKINRINREIELNN